MKRGTLILCSAFALATYSAFGMLLCGIAIFGVVNLGVFLLNVGEFITFSTASAWGVPAFYVVNFVLLFLLLLTDVEK